MLGDVELLGHILELGIFRAKVRPQRWKLSVFLPHHVSGAKGYKKCFHSGVPNPAYYQDKLVHLKQNQKKEGKKGKKKGRKRKEGRKRNNTKKSL